MTRPGILPLLGRCTPSYKAVSTRLSGCLLIWLAIEVMKQDPHQSLPDGARPDYWAAIDLGSNSFHLLIVQQTSSGVLRREQLKEKVQLMADFADGEMRAASIERGVACLRRFAQRIAGIPRSQVHVMGTCVLRRAANRDVFLRQVEATLGVPASVISGEEEARLIHRGVAQTVEPLTPAEGGVEHRLVVDIGGGSTEFAYSDNRTGLFEVGEALSVDVGCVMLRDQFFADELWIANGLSRAKAQVLRVLRTLNLPHSSHLRVLGTSGTIESIRDVLQANGWDTQHITRAGLEALQQAFTERRWVADVGLPGVAPERLDIFPPGVAILSALFEVLGIECLEFVDASLQQGMILRALDAAPAVQIQAQTVDQLCTRYRVDRTQAARVEDTAMRLFSCVADRWWDDAPAHRSLLVWGARLHEVGLSVGARSYHRHGAYLIKNSDMAGFTEAQQGALALLVRGHRRSFPGLAFAALGAGDGQDLLRLVVLLRLAVILERAHCDERRLAELRLRVEGSQLTLALPAAWLRANSLSATELEVEARQLVGVGLHLRVDAK